MKLLPPTRSLHPLSAALLVIASLGANAALAQDPHRGYHSLPERAGAPPDTQPRPQSVTPRSYGGNDSAGYGQRNRGSVGADGMYRQSQNYGQGQTNNQTSPYPQSPSSGQFRTYDQPGTGGRPQGYSQPQGIQQSPGYSQPRAYGQPQGGRPQGYGQPQGGQPQGYGRSQTYGQPQGYGQPQNNARFGGGQGQRGSFAGQSSSGQSPVTPSTQAIPNHNANYTGMSQQPIRQNPAQRFWQQQPDSIGANGTRGEHLQQWMEHHNSLNSQDQQRALQREPGFTQLPQQTQQRMLDRLQRLNSMPQDQRERTLQHSEQMERLSPNQRGEVRSAMGQLGALPQDRRRAVARSFRELRPMSPDQRNQLLNSPGYRQQFSDQERTTLNNLLTVSPMLPQQ